MLSIRAKVLSGKSCFMKKAHWEFINDLLKHYDKKHISHILGGIESEEVNGDTVLIVSNTL
jgi:hypothetical protein